MQPDITVAVGFTLAGVRSLNALRPAGSVIIIEEPDVCRKRALAAEVAELGAVIRVLPFPHTEPGAAELLHAELVGQRVASVVPLNEYATIAAAHLGELFGCPSAGRKASETLRDKSVLREISARGGIANPRSRVVATLAEAETFAAELDRPVIVKPANRQGSVGTVIVRDSARLAEAWAQSLDRDEGILVPDRPFPVKTLIEEFVEGREYSVEALVQNGRMIFSNVTAKELFPGARPVERAHMVPAPLPPASYARLVERTQMLLQIVEFRDGIVHCEWLLRDEEPCLVECAGRFAGDGIIDLISRAYSFDIVDVYHRLMRGEPIDPLPSQAGRTAAIRFLSARPGHLRAIETDQAALDSPGIVHHEVSLQVGQRTRYPVSSWDRAGDVTVEAPEPAAALALLDRAEGAIRFIYRSESEDEHSFQL